ncbi:hypothetical protein ALC62_11172 [Cyphomyrmex costatus]|uniref:Uncharacterized protein n=1 Tax=Cyphomyrmex costatus TaxID=456900 RepID=A0A195CD91_9HYME|nr:hypothetical protein ALC62_11172 [Cyphomyrmex costatus]
MGNPKKEVAKPQTCSNLRNELHESAGAGLYILDSSLPQLNQPLLPTGIHYDRSILYTVYTNTACQATESDMRAHASTMAAEDGLMGKEKVLRRRQNVVKLPLEYGLRVGMANGSFANAIGRIQGGAAS